MTKAADSRISFFQLVTLILSVVLLVGLLADATTRLPPGASRIIQRFDTTVCALLFVDFVIRFRAAPHKLKFLKWGWIDLLACIPNLDSLRWGRLVRIVRVIRVLRAVRSFQRIVSILLQHRTRNGVASVFVTFLLLVVFASVGILIFESTPEANIRSAEDAVWWSVTTITTVGYGDKYPVTTEGRAIAMVLMVSGVGLFGTLSGVIATHLLGAAGNEDTNQQVLKELQELRARLDSLTGREPGTPRETGNPPGEGPEPR